jgi:two-component system sensor histidine kinase KdpD
VALREVAEEVGAKRITTAEPVGSREETIAKDAPLAVSERLLALVEPYPGAQRLVRRAWRSAQRLGAQIDLVWIRPPARELTPDQERSLRALRELASLLGAHMVVEESDDVAAAVAEVARARGTTYVLLGRSRPARGLARLRTPLPQRLMELLPGVDVRIVADRAHRNSSEEPR